MPYANALSTAHPCSAAQPMIHSTAKLIRSINHELCAVPHHAAGCVAGVQSICGAHVEHIGRAAFPGYKLGGCCVEHISIAACRKPWRLLHTAPVACLLSSILRNAHCCILGCFEAAHAASCSHLRINNLQQFGRSAC